MNRGLRLTPKMIADLAEGYKQGKTTTELSHTFSISKATICRALRKVGIEPERKDSLFQTKEFTLEQKNAIELDFRAGLSIRDLTRKYECGTPIMIRVLEEKELWTKKTIEKPARDLSKIVKSNDVVRHLLSKQEQLGLCEKFVDGPYTKIELADEYKVHIDTVSAILRRHDALIKRYIPEEVVDLVCEEYKAGSTIYTLAKAYNQNPMTIKYWLTKRKIVDTLEIEGHPLTPTVLKPKWSTAQLRDAAKEDTQEMHEILVDIARDPTAGVRNRITAAALIIERGHGKPREEAEEEKDTESSTDKIVKLLGSNLQLKKKQGE